MGEWVTDSSHLHQYFRVSGLYQVGQDVS
jgi:hypothetical protein